MRFFRDGSASQGRERQIPFHGVLLRIDRSGLLIKKTSAFSRIRQSQYCFTPSAAGNPCAAQESLEVQDEVRLVSSQLPAPVQKFGCSSQAAKALARKRNYFGQVGIT